ncbi:MAG TPA: metalloregulator ArsR/SmtB family transcription factor [Syntrophomonadaceae bacterium]|nr:metalloregulator ArsR/SmtB family transcription factor [Syntrophomonadaceae bacterium]
MREMAELFKALGDEKRLQMIKLLSEGETCVCEFIEVLGISQPAVSHHMKILKQAGLVHDRREGRWIYYRLDEESIAAWQEILTDNLITPIRINLSMNAGCVKSAVCQKFDQLPGEKRKGGK